jgi:flagellin-specific chaperone FliS
MAPQTGLHSYYANGISTSSQAQLILMMYDGALQAVNQSIQCMDLKMLPGKANTY